MEDGAVSASDKGTPQGGLASPILANIYLHYSLDLWFTRIYQKSCYGQSHIIRYADDFVVCFQHKVDATRFRHELDERMKRITSRKKFTAKIWMFRDWLKANRTLPTRELMEKVVSKLRGHFAYYGVTDNSKGISRFAYEIQRFLFKWLNRRGKRGCMNWEKTMVCLEKKRFSILMRMVIIMIMKGYGRNGNNEISIWNI